MGSCLVNCSHNNQIVASEYLISWKEGRSKRGVGCVCGVSSVGAVDGVDGNVEGGAVESNRESVVGSESPNIVADDGESQVLVEGSGGLREGEGDKGLVESLCEKSVVNSESITPIRKAPSAIGAQRGVGVSQQLSYVLQVKDGVGGVRGNVGIVCWLRSCNTDVVGKVLSQNQTFVVHREDGLVSVEVGVGYLNVVGESGVGMNEGDVGGIAACIEVSPRESILWSNGKSVGWDSECNIRRSSQWNDSCDGNKISKDKLIDFQATCRINKSIKDDQLVLIISINEGSPVVSELFSSQISVSQEHDLISNKLISFLSGKLRAGVRTIDCTSISNDVIVVSKAKVSVTWRDVSSGC